MCHRASPISTIKRVGKSGQALVQTQIHKGPPSAKPHCQHRQHQSANTWPVTYLPPPVPLSLSPRLRFHSTPTSPRFRVRHPKNTHALCRAAPTLIRGQRSASTTPPTHYSTLESQWDPLVGDFSNTPRLIAGHVVCLRCTRGGALAALALP